MTIFDPDCDGRNWRHGLQALELLKVIIRLGCERTYSQSLFQMNRISALCKYKHAEEPVENQVILIANSVMSILRNSSEYVKSHKVSYSYSYEMKDFDEFKFTAITRKQSSQEKIEEAELLKHLVSEFEELEKLSSNFSVHDEILKEAYQKYENYRNKSVVMQESPLFPPFLPMHNSFKYKEKVLNVKPQKVVDLLDFGIPQPSRASPELKTNLMYNSNSTAGPTRSAMKTRLSTGDSSKSKANNFDQNSSPEHDLLDFKRISLSSSIRQQSQSSSSVPSSADDILNFAFAASTSSPSITTNKQISQDLTRKRQ